MDEGRKSLRKREKTSVDYRKPSKKREKTIVNDRKPSKKREKTIVDGILEDENRVKWLVDEDGMEMMSDVTDESTTDESTNGEKKKTSRVKLVAVRSTISKRNRVLFERVTREYQDTVEKAEQSFMKKCRGKVDPNPYPKKIRIGNFKIYTWYTSLYPLECAAATTLHICDFCLRYFVEESLYKTHVSRCQLRHPPGDEIYRKDDISVYEVDGYDEKDYCRRASLLGKCFIDCKSSVNGGPMFLFYVLTRNDLYGQHFVGYFSKSKEFQGYALSCIAILPCFHGYRYGHFLIELSYRLMQRQSLKGTPERPLTESGRIAYSLYWRSKILEWFGQREGQLPKEMNLYSIAKETGITVEDLANTMDLMDWFGSSKDNPEEVGSIDVKWAEVKHYMTNKQSGIIFDKDSFKWTPGVYNDETGKPERMGKMADDGTGKCERVDRKAKPSIVQTPTQKKLDQEDYGVTTSDEAGFAVVHDNAKGLVLLEASNVHYDQPSTSRACFNTHTTDIMTIGSNGDDIFMRPSERRQLGMSLTKDDVQNKNKTEIKQEVAPRPSIETLRGCLREVEHEVIANSVPSIEKLRHTRRRPEPWQLDFKALKKFRWSDLGLYAWNETDTFGEANEPLHGVTTEVAIFRRCKSLPHF